MDLRSDGFGDDQILSALTRYRDTQFATLIVSTIEIMASTHPVEFRRALSRVFDTRALEQRSIDAAAICQQAMSQAQQMAADIQVARDEAMSRLTELNRALDQLAKRVQRAETALNGQANGHALPSTRTA